MRGRGAPRSEVRLGRQLRAEGRRDEAVKLYRELAKDVRTKEGSEAAYYVLESTFGSGDMDKTEKEVFAFSEREPQAYWLAKAFILLGDVYVKKGDNFQARQRGRVSPTVIRLPTTASWTKRRRESQNSTDDEEDADSGRLRGGCCRSWLRRRSKSRSK